jgi:CRP-like cAMP-binding protein
VRERVFTALQRAQIPLAIPAGALFMANETAERRQRQEHRRRSRIRTALGQVALFSGLTEEELDQLASSIKSAPFVDGEMVLRQGAQAHSLYLLLKGRVAIQVTTPQGAPKRVRELTAPDFFGEMALMTGAPREASVIALSDLECLRVDRSAFAALLERRPEIAKELAEIVAERRVAVDAAREHLDAESRDRRVEGESSRILAALQGFFGLER